jgi:hypothetical protein
MHRYRQRRKRMRLGFVTGVLAFCAGWAVIALLAPQGVFNAPAGRTHSGCLSGQTLSH